MSQMWGPALVDFWCDPCSSDSLRGIVFLQKNAKIAPGIATSGRHNSAVITNAKNSRPNGLPADV